MPGFDFQSLFTDQPQRQPSGSPGAEPEWRIKPTSFAEDDADPRFPAFQQAWKQGAGLNDLFGPDPFKLQGTVAPSGGDNTRPDVAKVQTLLGKAGYVGIRDGGPNGYPSDMLDGAIRRFQQDKGLKVDGVLKPGGPTITALGGLLGGGEKQSQTTSWRYPMDEKPGGRDPWDIPGATPPYFPAPKPKPQPTGSTQDSDVEALIRIMNGGKTPSEPRPQPQPTPPRLPRPNDFPIDGDMKPDDWDRLRGHTINQDGIESNQGYAEMLVRDSDPSQTARMLKRTIDEYGDQGRGDVADLLGRFQKVDANKAEALRREIAKATGEMLPYRIAPLGEGFREPTEEDRIAAAPKVPFGSAQGADRWAAGNMAEVLLGRGDYADAITHFRGEIGQNRGADMPYLAAVHEIMGDKNPGLAAKFATQMRAAGLTETPDGPQPDGTFRITIRPPAEPEGAPVDVAGPGSGSAGTKDPLDPKYGDATTAPEWKKDTLNAQGDAWKSFNASIGKLSGVSDNERFVYGQIFAAEGGNAVDPNSGASSGVTKQTLEDARNAGAVPGLDKVKSPGDLTADQRAGIMRWYFDKTMEKAGGSAALDKIGDKLAAGALADSLYRHGSSGGTKLIQDAINRVNGNKDLKVDGGMGKDTFDAYSKLVSNPEARDKLLNTLADLRDTATQGKEKDRMDHYRPKK